MGTASVTEDRTQTKQGEEEMKKMMLVMAAGAMLTAAVAHADTVTSVNVVGYYSVTIPAGKLALVTPVLESFEPGTLQDLIGDQLPAGSSVHVWDRASTSYRTVNYLGFPTPSWSDTNLILRGDALWIQPSGATEQTVTFMGEVPGNYNAAGTTTVFNVDGADAVGYSYPVDMLWTNTAIAQAAPAVSTVHFWDITNGTWNTFNYAAPPFGSGWGGANSKVIKAGEAFWVETSSTIDWTETAPYDL